MNVRKALIIMTLPNLTTHMKTCNGGLYTCNECGEGFKTLPNQTTHMKTRNRGLYTCNKCEKGFNNYDFV